jgi:hypothetical protein
MAANFHHLSLTESVKQAQRHYYGGSEEIPQATHPDELSAEEIEFIQARLMRTAGLIFNIAVARWVSFGFWIRKRWLSPTFGGIAK